MAIVPQFDAQTTGSNHLRIDGSFIPNGTNNTIATKFGTGFTVVRAGTAGVYTVTLSQKFANFVSINLTLQMATSDTQVRVLRVGDQSVSNKTFQIVHLASANTTTTHPLAADINTSGTANKIHFSVVVAMSDVPGAGV